MTDLDDLSKPLRPTCGILSLALPLTAAAAVAAVIRLAPEGDSGTLGTFILAFYSLVISMIAGVILAVIALVRREKWRGLPCLTLALDLIGLVLLLKLLI